MLILAFIAACSPLCALGFQFSSSGALFPKSVQPSVSLRLQSTRAQTPARWDRMHQLCAMSASDDDIDHRELEASKQFWLDLVEAKMAVKRQEESATATVDNGRGSTKLAPATGILRPAGKFYSALEAKEIVNLARDSLEDEFREIDARTQVTLKRILDSFRRNRVGPHLFCGTDGYGHGDFGRDTLDAVFAELFGAEQALVRVQFFSGTHAITCALFSVLRPGDEMLAISGSPYDTLEEVIGLRKEDPVCFPYPRVSFDR